MVNVGVATAVVVVLSASAVVVVDSAAVVVSASAVVVVTSATVVVSTWDVVVVSGAVVIVVPVSTDVSDNETVDETSAVVVGCVVEAIEVEITVSKAG